MRFFLFLTARLLLVCFVGPVFAQPVTYLGIEDGLSNNTVTSIYKDKYGFMWFGTFDGLNRFDGYGFTKFRNQYGDSSSLPYNHVTTIDQDRDGKLWVATQKGIGILDEKTLKFQTVKYLPSQNDSRILNLNAPVNSLKADSGGNVYIGTMQLGLMALKKGTSAAKQIPLVLNSKKTVLYSVYSLNIDSNGILWFLTDYGFCRYNPKSFEIKLITSQVKNGTCIEFDSGGNIWMGTNAGLFYYNPKSNEIFSFETSKKNLSSSRILDICFEKNNKLWIATDGDGVFVVDVTSKTVTQRLKQQDNQSLSSNATYTIFIDDEDRKWIGTMRGGVNIIDPKKNRFHTIRHEPYNSNSLVHNTVMSFCEDGDDIWVGTDGGGISIWNRKLNTYRNHVFSTADKYSYGANQITSIVKDEHGDIWISTYGSGVKKYIKSSGKFVDIPFVQTGKGAMYVWKLYLDSDRNLWAGCLKGRWSGDLKKGLFKLNKQENRFYSANYPVFSEVLSIADDTKGNLWIGTLKGLLKVNKRNAKVKEYNLETYIRSLKFDADRRLWIGTQGRGLLSLDSSYKKLNFYTEDHGLPNNIVVNIEEDKTGRLWVSTFNGLSRFNVKTSKFENFYVSDGLQSNQFYYNASTRLNTGEMLFGGIKGFNFFDPDKITVYNEFPSIRITGMRVLNSAINAQSEYIKNAPNICEIHEIVLPYEKSMFSLDFVALEYSLPNKIQYAYYLKGWDKAWNYTKNIHSVSYSRLNEGTYTLEIKSTNVSGVWNKDARLIKITVLPPWYRSWWAYCLYLAICASGIYTFIYYQKRQARLLYEVKLAKLKSSQEAELTEKKISFFINISHELRTPLTLIVNPIKDLLNNDGKNINLVDISSVYRNTRRLLSLVDQLLLFKSTENEISDLKPEVLDLIEVCNEVFLCFNNQVKSRSINYDFKHHSPEIKVFADREKIEIVLFNLLSNAIKFTPEGGSVSLEVVECQTEIELYVRDSGPGIPDNVGDKLFNKFYRLEQSNQSSKKTGFGVGLFISKVIAGKQEGTLSYTSKLAEGTTFKYTLPVKLEGVSTELVSLDAKSKNTNLFDELIIETTDHDSAEHRSTRSDEMNQIYNDVVENKPNVLLIDDDSELRSYIRQILSNEYTVFEADSAERGLEVLKKSEPDIIICDVVMQGMSGVEFCSLTKSSKEFAYIPFILLTGTSSPEIKLKGIECGADDYITKPFEKELFIARIKGILKGRDSLKKYFFNEVTLQNNNEKVSEEYSLFLQKCFRIVEKHLEDDQFNVRVFVKEMGMSHSTLFRKVKSISGLSISEFIRYLRLKKAAELMIETDIQVKEVAYKVGMQDIRYFREQFSKLFGLNPSEYIKKYRRTFLRAPGNHSLKKS